MKNDARQLETRDDRGQTVRDGSVVGGVRVVRMKPRSAAGPVVVDSRAGTGPVSAGLGLSDLVDRASAQLMILRRTLDEATALGNAARRESDVISERVANAQRAREQIEERIRQAGTALSVMDRAGETVRALEDVVARVRGVREAMLSEMDRRLESQKKAFDARVAEMVLEQGERLERQEEAWAERFARLESLMEARFGDVETAIPERIELIRDAAVIEIERAGEGVRAVGERGVKAIQEAESRSRSECDRIVAGLDRQSAQAQARASVAIDEAQGRVMELERSAERAGHAIKGQVDDLRKCAAEVLGVAMSADPGAEAWRERASTGSVAEMVLRAEAAMQSAGRATDRLHEAVQAAEGTIDRALTTIGAASEGLERVLAKSEGRSLLLEKCMEDATRQAESMIVVARDLGELIERSEGAPGASGSRSPKGRRGAQERERGTEPGPRSAAA